MTEKRFVLVCDNNVEWLMQTKLFLPIKDNNINKKITLKQCFDLLNELNDKCEFLEIENESLEDSATKYAELYHKSLKENEQLKQGLRDYHNAFDCNQCMYHNYDWYDDGDEFEICDKGNNEARMKYHSCKDWEEL